MPTTAPYPADVPDLCVDWLFGGRYAAGAEASTYDDTLFTPVVLPHCVADLSWHDWDPASWDGEWIYRRHLQVPEDLRDRRLFVEFDGVLTSATVVLNDRVLGRHLGGYLPFQYEITGLVRDRGEDNVLAVVVDGRWQQVPPDGHPDGPAAVDYCQPAGIYREARLVARPAVFVDDVFAKPVDVLRPDRYVDVVTTVDAAEVPAGRAVVTTELRDGAATVASASAPAPLEGAGATAVRSRLDSLDEVELWHVDRPRLYDVVTTLSIDGAEWHRHETRIGFREAEWRRDGFVLNGERLQVFGLNRHQIFPYAGHAMPARVQRRDAEILKHELHANMVRCAHYPPSRHFLDACDELGLMVWEEPPGWQYLPDDPTWLGLALRDVREMVRRDRNRPSIVLWGARLNETRNLPDFYRRTKAAITELDGSRRTSGAMIPHSTDDWVQDVFGYDDYAGDRINAFLRPPLQNVPYLVSECVGALSSRPLYRRTDPPGALAQQAIAHAQVHDIARSDPAYAGVLAWLAFDYGSQNGNVHRNVKTPGVADLFREPKPGALFYRSQVDPRVQPVLEPAFAWELGAGLPPRGPGSRATIWSNCERLELFVGDEHVGTAHPDRTAFPHLDHPPFVVSLHCDPDTRPELRIDGYLDAELVISRRMASDPTGDHLALCADDAALIADGSDMTRLVVRAVDRYGNVRTGTGGTVGFRIDGPATLVGDDPFDFADSPGVGAVWLRAGRDTGSVTVTADHPELGNAAVEVALCVREGPAG